MQPSTPVILPMAPVEPEYVNAQHMVIFSKPKVGKTTIFAQLPGNLILDLQNGAGFVKALKIKANSLADIYNIGQAIREAGHPYPVITIDTGSDLEDMCWQRAEQIYAATPMGSTWFADKTGDFSKGLKAQYGSLINMPNGAGYNYLRQAFEETYNFIKSLAPATILSCHVKDAQLAENNAAMTPMALDLTGKIKQIVSAHCDAIGHLFRRGEQNILSFKTTGEVTCGARPDHLKNQEIVISERDPVTGVVTAFWDRVYKNV